MHIEDKRQLIKVVIVRLSNAIDRIRTNFLCLYCVRGLLHESANLRDPMEETNGPDSLGATDSQSSFELASRPLPAWINCPFPFSFMNIEISILLLVMGTCPRGMRGRGEMPIPQSPSAEFCFVRKYLCRFNRRLEIFKTCTFLSRIERCQEKWQQSYCVN